MSDTLQKFIEPVKRYLDSDLSAIDLVEKINGVWDSEEENLIYENEEYDIADNIMMACDSFEPNKAIRKDSNQYLDEKALKTHLKKLLKGCS